MSTSGWLTTKKRGRDDDLIERDRQKAAAARGLKTKKKPSSVVATKNKVVKKGASKQFTSRVSRSDDDDDDDDDSMDSFIVHSDEELSKVDEESESEEEVGMDTYLGLSTKRRVSKPPPSMQRKPIKGRSQPSSRPFSRKPQQKPAPHKKPDVVNLADATSEDDDDSSDGELEIVDKPSACRCFANPSKVAARVGNTVNHNASRAQTSKRGRLLELDDSDSDDSLLENPMAVKKRMPATTKNKGNSRDPFESDSDISLSAQRKTGPTKQANVTRALDSDSDDDDNGSRPALSGRLRKKILAVANDSKKMAKSSKTKKKPKYSAFQNGDDDEDEAIAMALAMSRSENEKGGLMDDDEESVVDMLLEESSSEEERDDEQDDYVDPAAREATSILEQANSLSRQIMETLSRWSNSSDGNAATMGLIQNGAVSLSTTEHVQNSKDHQWISAEVMASICPNITLSEYQLIGVNWMALLNGMKCKVNGSRGHANVNGILADGKTFCGDELLSAG